MLETKNHTPEQSAFEPNLDTITVPEIYKLGRQDLHLLKLFLEQKVDILKRRKDRKPSADILANIQRELSKAELDLDLVLERLAKNPEPENIRVDRKDIDLINEGFLSAYSIDELKLLLKFLQAELKFVLANYAEQENMELSERVDDLKNKVDLVNSAINRRENKPLEAENENRLLHGFQKVELDFSLIRPENIGIYTPQNILQMYHTLLELKKRLKTESKNNSFKNYFDTLDEKIKILSNEIKKRGLTNKKNLP